MHKLGDGGVAFRRFFVSDFYQRAEKFIELNAKDDWLRVRTERAVALDGEPGDKVLHPLNSVYL